MTMTGFVLGIISTSLLLKPFGIHPPFGDLDQSTHSHGPSWACLDYGITIGR